MYLLGLDIGTSSIKATLMDCENREVAGSAVSPEKEMVIEACKAGYAEQDPEMWWDNVRIATGMILEKVRVEPSDIKAIGITYQMHGLVIVDDKKEVLRPAIIWCDSRAVETGNKAFNSIGSAKCLSTLLNSPGNFTASKLGWVKDNEPELFSKVYKFMLPGDYIAMKLTDRIATTESGLSEGIFWNFKEGKISNEVMDYFGFEESLVPQLVPSFGNQGELTDKAAEELGLCAGTAVTYRAGDQPNNAFSLNVLEPGEIAATAGTSGVVYGIGDSADHDPYSRVNTFLHVNNSKDNGRYGVLLCINGTGILNSWLKHNVAGRGEDYDYMNSMAEKISPGCDGLMILPFGNGAERTLRNKNIGSSVHNLDFNIHHKGHLMRAGQEAIVFALNYGISIMKDISVEIETVRAGKANMFLSRVFTEAFSTVTNSVVELYDTDGSAGAARAAGVGAGIFKSFEEAFENFEKLETVEPNEKTSDIYAEVYEKWVGILEKQLG